MHFAPAVKILEYYGAYKKDKKGTVENLTTRLRDEIQKLLDREVQLSERLFPENYIF